MATEIEPTTGATTATPRRYEGGDLLVAALAERGVERIFSVSGGPLNSIYHATAGSRIALVHTRHEAGAAFMADATARVTGVPGVCAVTLGPGVTNTATATLTAHLAGVPVLIVGGQAPLRTSDRGAGMSFDPIPLMTPVTKWAARVLHTDRIPEYVDAAWRIMLAGRPGPVFLELPVDVLGAETSPEALGRRRGATHFGPGVSDQAVAAVEAALSGARRPLLIAGDDVRWTEAGGLLARWIEREATPFALARLARGAVSERHPLCAGTGYLPANRTLRKALGEADLVLLLGHTWEFDLGFGDTVPEQATVIQVHPDEALVGKNLVPSIGVTARAGELLRALLDRPGDRPAARDVAWAEQVGADWRGERGGQLQAARGSSEPMHPLVLVEELVATAPPDTIWVTSHGNVDFWADQAIQAHGVDGYLRAGQSGSLGAEVPYGVAAKLARPERPVVVFVGDGGFGFHGFELETAARSGAPIVVVIADDEKWGAIALPQERAYGVQVEMDLPGRDWAQLAATLGARGERARRPAEVGPALRRLLEGSTPGVLHASVACVESPYMRAVSGA